MPVPTSLVVETLARPEHRVEPNSVRCLLAATELRGSCRLGYRSMTTAEARERVVCPHAIVRASGRYHVRAFDYSRRRFIDFSLSRVLSSEALADDPSVPATLDDNWHATVDVKFVPHTRLSPTQRATTAREFDMRDGSKTVAVRRAMLFYLLDEMRLLAAVRHLDENLADAPIWIRNAEQVAAELSSMDDEG